MEKTETAMQAVSWGQVEKWALLAGGGVLFFSGLVRRHWKSLPLSVLGGIMVYEGIKRHRHSHRAMGARGTTRGFRVNETVAITRAPEELYRFWRELENLPRFMSHLESVKRLDDRRSHWVAKGPAGMKVEWDAEIVREIENELIAWQSLENADVFNAGSVSFRWSPEEKGTRVKVVLRYVPPAGALGAAFAKLFGEDPAQQVREDLLRFKQIMEAAQEAPAPSSGELGKA